MSETSETSKTGPLVGIAVVGVVAAIAIAITLHLRSESTSEVTGSLTLGDATFEPQRCRSSLLGEDRPRDRPRFRGVDLMAASGTAVRVLEDPSVGRRVLVIPPGGDPRPIDRDACQRFDVQLRDTGEAIMSVWGLEGSVELDCPDARGSVRFLRCYGGR